VSEANPNDIITQGSREWTRPTALAYNVMHDNEMAGTVDCRRSCYVVDNVNGYYLRLDLIGAAGGGRYVSFGSQ
jgi:hypothetical protein